MIACHLEECADDLRLRIAKHEDLDLVLRIPKAAHKLHEHALDEQREALDDRAERGAVEGEQDPVGQRYRGRHTRRPIEDRPFPEEVTGSQDGEAPLDHTYALE